MGFHFDLIDEPWIPCLDADGTARDVGLREALVRANELREMRDQSPLVTAALYKLLLAIVHRVVQGPRSLAEWKSIWERRRFESTQVDTYLEKWRRRFDLFDPKLPFFQFAGFEVKGGDEGRTPVGLLAHETARGSNTTLFDHSSDDRPPEASPAEAARWLVAFQSFALQGGKGPTSNLFGEHPYYKNAVSPGGVSFFLQGDNLFEALVLNLLVYEGSRPLPSDGHDAPDWEVEPIERPGERPPHGYLDLLTLRSRCVRLVPEGAEGGRTVVRWMHYAQGSALERGEENVVNPQWAYTGDEKRGLWPVGLRTSRALWRDSASLFIARPLGGRSETRPLAFAQAADMVRKRVLDAAKALRCVCVGLENDQAKVVFWRLDELPIPARLLSEDELGQAVLVCLEGAEEAAVSLSKALGGLSAEMRGSQRGLREQGKAAFWASLEVTFRRLVFDLPDKREDAAKTWREVVRESAMKAFDQTADNALGRTARELRARTEAGKTLSASLFKILGPREEVPA